MEVVAKRGDGSVEMTTQGGIDFVRFTGAPGKKMILARSYFPDKVRG